MDDDFILDLAKIPPITLRKSEDFNVYLARIKICDIGAVTFRVTIKISVLLDNLSLSVFWSSYGIDFF